jgi:aspartate/methionine/tyrosine aminotransferase
MKQQSVPFPLKPIKTATVSVISEATASASVPVHEKINFHIGNPLQDERLVDRYFEICSGFSAEGLDNKESSEIEPTEKLCLNFLKQAIKNAVPYTPRGGYSVKNQPEILKHLHAWLINQDDPLLYSFGENSARECVISNGGVNEFLRIFFSTISNFSVNLPLNIVTINFPLPQFFQDFSYLNYLAELSEFAEDPDLLKILHKEPGLPLIILIGKKLSEKERSLLVKSTAGEQVLFCELLDLKNNQSLARESGLRENVIRLLTPGIFNPLFQNYTTQFVLGNAEIIKLFAAMHFELKGTPSSTEKDWLEFSIQNPFIFKTNENGNRNNFLIEDNPLLKKVQLITQNQTKKISNKVDAYSSVLEKVSAVGQALSSSYLSRFDGKYGNSFYNDEFEFKPAVDLLPLIQEKSELLIVAFLNQFVKHHSQYNVNNCCAVSGSARTALSLLGKHCGIREVVTFDWSWSYENGFYDIFAVPLLLNDHLNDEGLLELLKSKIHSDPSWKKYGAVILNNPHNASGRVFEEKTLKSLLINLLANDFVVIDDLCYQDVAPAKLPVKIKTLKELAVESVKSGLLQSEKLVNLITAHSLSKTDCYAGARLTVVEISHPVYKKRFKTINDLLYPNSMALFLSYLFYRNDSSVLKIFWGFRNNVFYERAEAIRKALEELPVERNPFKINIILPQGSMYPQMVIENFPPGISIDNISAKLSARGIGLVPLTAFSKTKEGYDGGRKTFRLTLGGTDDAETMGNKTRTLLIELNRLLKEESRDYHLITKNVESTNEINPIFLPAIKKWNTLIKSIEIGAAKSFNKIASGFEATSREKHFINNYLPWRINIFEERFYEVIRLHSKVIKETQTTNPILLSEKLSHELYKDDITERQLRFKNRLFDRTVHPTQMYALNVDLLIEKIFSSLIYGSGSSLFGEEAGLEIVKEYFGKNIAINSEQEAHELIFDLRAVIRNELYSGLQSAQLLSFWGDWDGSTRPSGQGHRLVAAVLIENVRHMAYFLKTIHLLSPGNTISESLLSELNSLPDKSKKFWELLNKITSLTMQFEKNYKGLLPTNFTSGRFRALAVKFKLVRDPLKSLFLHNNRLERKMLNLRHQRKNSLEYYFDLNKRLRKKLNELVPFIIKNIHNPRVALLAGGYRDLLKRFVLTPRIHQKTITSPDPFTIENTVHNMSEINQIGSRFGNPGLILALQISMSTSPEALIDLNRMISRKREQLNNEDENNPIKDLWLIPLFEDQETVNNLGMYLDPVWNYAENSRSLNQSTDERFKEIICEIFVAGSDLSQQVGQPESINLYKQTKIFFYKWLAYKGLLNDIRIKLGCGEPIQRQGGYYSELSGKPTLYNTKVLSNKSIKELSEPAIKSLYYATSPLAGLHSGGDLRTIQSNAAERIFRFITFKERSVLLHHMESLQNEYKKDLKRVGKMFLNTRRDLEDKGVYELKRISRVSDNEIFLQFLKFNRDSFRQIIYGKDEDIVGIHVISYFISRMVPTLRDRPTVRPTKDGGQSTGQKIMERISQTLPMSHHGSILRAIGHNRSQSVILGVSQATTGLFRSLKMIFEKYNNQSVISQILIHLPVREFLYDLRIYQQVDMKYIKKITSAFKSGNSALRALNEDMQYMHEFIPYLQQALIARQGLSPSEFYDGNKIKSHLLACFRPDLAVLLQENLFNPDISKMGVDTKETDMNWISETSRLLSLPSRLKIWREKSWELIENKIYNQVSSFVDLAIALTTLSQKAKELNGSLNLSGTKKSKLASQVNSMLMGSADDSMRNFLFSVVEYISHLPHDSTQLPIDTVRALNDVERIVKIDAQPLTENEQEKLNYYILQMARMAKENG